MAQSNFVDYVKMYLKSGKGGPGSAHFRREKFAPKGGPDGGDGGRGGHIIVKANSQLWTLLHLKYKKHVFASNGMNGGGALKSGAQGEDVVIDVPLGTVIKNEKGEVLAELTEANEEIIILEGGKGGLGNDHFKSSTNQSPRYAQSGLPGKELTVIMELKLLADVGLVGFPNAGKSTLLSVLSAAKPEIADYPFTTLRPNLGVVSYRDNKSFVMADIPGIIEGAAEGKGLGHRFLRHIERNSVLLFMIPGDSANVMDEYKVLLNELQKYNPELLVKPRVMAISKSDLLDDELEKMISSEIELPHVFISALTNKNMDKLKDILWQTINSDIQ